MDHMSESSYLLVFLNSGLGLLLLGALLGAIGLFTWQRQDWLFKQRHLRAQVMVDRRLDLIERVNSEVGRLLATATAPAVAIYKGAGKTQIDQAVSQYNDQQVDWFTAYPAHQALLGVYFPDEVSEAFSSKIVGAYENLDVKLSAYVQSRDRAHYAGAYQALQDVRGNLQAWNALALQNLAED